MKIAVLDARTLGEDLSLEELWGLGTCVVHDLTPAEMVAERVADCDVIVVNKVRLDQSNLAGAAQLKLICVAATGYDNIDLAYCRSRGIGVCNVEGYSAHSVAQVTVAMVLSLMNHLPEYHDYVKRGEYSRSGVANCLTPVYHELYGKTWGIIGYGSIGKRVGAVAEAFGCNLMVHKRHPEEGVCCVDLDTLCALSDIITIHTPLTPQTREMIQKPQLAVMKKTAILVNASRGAVTDEAAVAEAIKDGEIGAFGTDVYAKEPLAADHPFYEIRQWPNVLLTPHMAWGAYEARMRCLHEICENIRAFFGGEIRSRVELLSFQREK